MIAVIVPCGARAGGVTIVLSNRFINTYANRATIDTTVDIAMLRSGPTATLPMATNTPPERPRKLAWWRLSRL
ncbi:MAG: hypothetical protein WBX26_05145 [Candidatus Cybelea sp.]